MIALLVAALGMLVQAAGPAGSIHGRVIDADTGRPVAHASIRLAAVDGSRDTSTWSDDTGAFRFDGLRPGRYNGLVTAPRHVPQSLGARGGDVTVAADQITEAAVRMTQTLTINVRVVDAFGDPLSDVNVSAMSIESGRTPFGAYLHTTDDLGRVRVSGLQPGRYILCASTNEFGRPTETAPSRDHLLHTCYPASDEESAEVVRLERSDLDGVEIRMRRGRTFSVSGGVFDSSGTATGAAQVSLNRFTMNSSTSISFPVDANGHFRIASVPPGAYTIVAALLASEGPMGPPPRESAFTSVMVQDANVDDVVVTMQKTVEVSGRVTLEDPNLPMPRALGSGFWIGTRLAGEGMAGVGDELNATMRPDRTFTLQGLFGARVLDFQNVPRGWYVKTARYGSRDVLDEAVTFKAGADSLGVVLSNRGATLTGSVTDDSGSPAGRAMIFLVRLGTDSGRLQVAASARASADGTFTAGPIRGGEYAVFALSPSSEVLPNASRARLARLVAAAEHVSLTDLDERSVQLKMLSER